MRVLVTGSRDWDDWDAIESALKEFECKFGDEPGTVIHGGYGGADFIAAATAIKGRWFEKCHEAEWEKHGRAAGPIRNQRMVDEGADICLAFPMKGSRGTWDCIRKAADAGIPVRIYPG